jgi:acyl CoA:acetate/3-ketoacid CoA transferase beta subunit
MVISELGVFDITPQGVVLTDIAPEVTVEEIRQKTEAGFTVHPDLHLAA